MRTSLPLVVVVLSACAARPAPPPVAPLASTASIASGTNPSRDRAPTPWVAPPSEAGALVRSISDEAGPRLAGSAGEARAEAWAERTMHALGLANVHTEPVRVPRWERGAEHGEVTAPYAHPMALAALGGSIGTPPEGIDADVVEVPSLEALAALPESSVRGRLVYVHEVMRRTRTGQGYGEAVPVRGRSASAAARKGAVAVLVRSMGTDNNRAPHTGQMHYAEDVPRIPAAALSTTDGDALHRMVTAAGESGGTVRFHLVLGCHTLSDGDGVNVVGEVPGSDLASQIVLLGAHLDSWDLGTGALDDGAGVAIVLSTARRVMQSRPPRRTVRVVLFANEENGLAGARAYAHSHHDELVRHAVALEADSGDGRVLSIHYGGAPSGAAAFHRIGALVRPMGVRAREGEAHGGEDLSPLGPAGVPRWSIRQDMSTYFDYHHTANDTPAVLDEAAIDQTVAVWATVVGELASMDDDLGRAPRETP